ncbi:MAG: hemolysin family protein [Ignavibacteria bacterium]|jgi:putative hemolysin
MNNYIIEIIIFLFFIISAGFLEAAEVAISSIGENKIDKLKEQKNKSVQYFERIQEDPESFFGSLKILHTTCIITSTATGIKILISIYFLNNNLRGNYLIGLIITLILITSLVVVFSLLIPKAIGFKYSSLIAIKSVKILSEISILMKIPVRALTFISNLLLMPIKEKTSFSQFRPSEDEILEIISDGVKSGAIDESEQEIIENILEFNDLKANEVMVPRTEMIAVDLNDDNDLIIKKIIDSGHSLIPAYKETPDNIIGVIHTKDMLRQHTTGQPLMAKQYLRPTHFVPETKPISEVLKEMQQIGERLVIVTDEYGGTEGIVTLEDVLEEIVGEIKNRTKVEISEFSRLADGTFCILGAMNVDDFNETFSHSLPDSEEYNTVAGFVAEKTGKILNHGESVKLEGLNFELIKKIRQKMVQFKVHSDKNTFGIKE